MDIATFAKDNGKTIRTIKKWIKAGLIPNADLSQNFIPDSARPPYFARAKSASSIYVSIVKASNARKHVCPKTYKLCNEEFNGYIDRLVAAGLIVKRTTDNVTYFDATIQACNINKEFILACIEKASSGISHGVATALIESNKAI